MVVASSVVPYGAPGGEQVGGTGSHVETMIYPRSIQIPPGRLGPSCYRKGHPRELAGQMRRPRTCGVFIDDGVGQGSQEVKPIARQF